MTTKEFFNMTDPNQREDDTVYFSGDTSDESWAGQIGDTDDMTDEMVNDYIKTSKPELFDKLRGMRFGSSDIPMTFQPQRDLQRLREMHVEFQNDISTTFKASQVKFLTPSTKTFATFTLPQGLETASQRQGATSSFSVTKSQSQLKFDGIDRQTVMSAAQRLYPNLSRQLKDTPVIRDEHVGSGVVVKHPTNSPQSLQLRALRQLEINQALTEVSKYEKCLRNAKEQLRRLEVRRSSPDASVLITRPLYMEPANERYKKQGLTQYDRTKYLKAQRREETDKKSSNLAQKVTPAKVTQARICYCRDYDDGSEMVRCSREWCPIGWFHLRCSGLQRLPFTYEEYHCAYCVSGVDHQISKKILDGDHYDPNNPACILVNQIAQSHRNQEMETEVVFEEQASPQPHISRRSAVYEGEDEMSDDEEQEEEDDNCEIQDQVDVVDKVAKWNAINDPYPRVAVSKTPLTPHDDRTSIASPTHSFFADDSDAGKRVDVERQEPDDDDASTIVLGSNVNSAKSFYSNKDGGTEQIDDGTNNYDVEETGFTDENSIIPTSKFVPIRQDYSGFSDSSYSVHSYPPQPSTITDSTHTNSSGTSALSVPLSDLPNEVPDFSSPNNDDNPRTPILAPRTSKAVKPWGTPVNVSQYTDNMSKDPQDFVLDPVSPSPAMKRKFSETDDDIDSDRERERNNPGSSDPDPDASDSDSETEEVIVFASPPRMFKTLQLKKHEYLPY